MGSFSDLDISIQDHIKRNILAPNDMADSDENKEMMAKAWLEKEKSFLDESNGIGMEETREYSATEPSAALLLTYSGSLIGIGPIEEGKRKVIYSSIGNRKDVPEEAVSEESIIDKDIAIGAEAVFQGGPIKQSSRIYKIAVMQKKLSIEDQKESVSEATKIISEEFADVNKTIILK